MIGFASDKDELGIGAVLKECFELHERDKCAARVRNEAEGDVIECDIEARKEADIVDIDFPCADCRVVSVTALLTCGESDAESAVEIFKEFLPVDGSAK